jgi:TB2/DP1, HVA22 family
MQQIDSTQGGARTRWLTYWCIFGIYRYLQQCLVPVLVWIPFSSHAQLAFLLWLQLPVFRGAYYILDKIRAQLTKLTPTHAEVVTLAAAAVPLPLSPQPTQLSESSKGNSSSQRRLSQSGSGSKQRRNSATTATGSSTDDTHDYDGIHQQHQQEQPTTTRQSTVAHHRSR